MKQFVTFTYRSAFMFLLACTLLPACKKFLDVPPQGAITKDEIESDPKAATDLVTGLYNGLWTESLHGFDYIGMTNIASDDGDKGSNPDDAKADKGALDQLTMDSHVGSINNVWSAYYRVIARGNQVLAVLPLSPATDQVKQQLEGEVRFLRGYLYFNMVRLFGGVPLIDTLPPNEELNNPKYQTRTPAPQVYASIITDLRYAADHLPTKGNTNVGRATKAAAMGLLAKVYLYQKNYQMAYQLTDSIVKQLVGSYDLLDNYADIWREKGNNSVESIFEVQTGINTACQATIVNYVQCQGPRQGGKGGWADLGWGFNTPSQSLLNAYEPGDKREAGTVIFITKTGTVLFDGFRIPGQDSVQNTTYNYKAYHSRTQEQFCGSTDYLPKNMKILRYGEILLIHAEAALALGKGAEADADILRLRTRAGLTGITGVTREQIWHERRVEMAMEHDRYFDLVRQDAIVPGRAAAAFKADGNKVWTANKNEVFPIPATQIQLSNGNLEQNPNYQ